jgi:prohibitin 1
MVLSLFLALGLGGTGCVRILQDEVGVKRKLGKIEDDVLYPGPNRYNPFNTKIFRVPTRTENLEIAIGLPSREGLTVRSEISILYRVEPEKVPSIVRNLGPEYGDSLILPVFRSASADVCARYYAKDMHSSKRAEIEQAIKKRMMEVVGPRGFVLESVLMKSIVLPAGLAQAIEAKLEAEQESQRMQFVLAQERQEADRRVIEAEGQKRVLATQAAARKDAAIITAEGQKEAAIIAAEGRAEAAKVEAAGNKEANDTLRSSLDAKIMKYLGIEAFRQLSQSQNAKVIVADDNGVLMNVE